MHDTDLEGRIRTVLREEGDGLPFTVDIERVEAGLAARQRSSRNLRFRLLAAAGIGIVAFGLGAVGLIRQPENAGVGASPTTQPGTPYAIDMLEAPQGEVMVDSSTPNRTPLGNGGPVRSETIGSVAPALQHQIAMICLGEGDLQLSFGHPDESDHVYTTSIPCDGQVHDDGLTHEFDDSREVVVQVNENAAWRVIVTGQGEGGVVLPTTLRAGPAGTARNGDVEATLACGYWIVPDEPNRSCDEPSWPALTTRTLRLQADDELLLSLGDAWRLAQIDLSAAPLHAGTEIARDEIVILSSGSPGSGRLQVPLPLDAGDWLLRAAVMGQDLEGGQFYADWYVPIRIRP